MFFTSKYSKVELVRMLKNIFLVIIGTAILSFGFAVFMLPFNLVSGGVAGIAIVLDMLIDVEFITVELIVTVLTWLIFFLGLRVLGKYFAMKTLVSSIVYPIALSLFSRLVSPDVLGGYFYLSGGEYSQIALLIAAILGGALIGVGCAITFLGGGSTGGTDIIAFIICKIFRNLKSSKVIFAIDALVVLLGVVVIGDFVISMLGVVAAMVAAILIDKLFLGGQKSFIAQIISDKHEQISRQIIEELQRGATIVDIVGAYSKQNKKMIMVSFTMRQYNQIINVINKTDKYAFVTVHRAHEINGEGWTR